MGEPQNHCNRIQLKELVVDNPPPGQQHLGMADSTPRKGAVHSHAVHGVQPMIPGVERVGTQDGTL